MAVNAKIKDLAPGAVFDIGPVKVKVMEHFADGKTLLTATEPIGNRPFTVRPFTFRRADTEPAANNFAFSTLKDDLNTDFLGAIDAAGVIPCLVAYACARYQGKSFVFKLSQRKRASLAQTLKIEVAMIRWNRALKKDPWGELGRIADFVCEWKKGDST